MTAHRLILMYEFTLPFYINLILTQSVVWTEQTNKSANTLSQVVFNRKFDEN